jgi:response regulator RpfG family c-di-GMP phosphodiesterase
MICIIDDDPLFVFALTKMIEIQYPNINIITFNNGKGAIDYFNSIVENNTESSPLPDAILLDLNMPVMDGWAFMNSYNKIHPLLKKEIRLYVISSTDNEADRTKALKYAEVTAFLTKPLKAADIKSIMQDT